MRPSLFLFAISFLLFAITLISTIFIIEFENQDIRNIKGTLNFTKNFTLGNDLYINDNSQFLDIIIDGLLLNFGDILGLNLTALRGPPGGPGAVGGQGPSGIKGFPGNKGNNGTNCVNFTTIIPGPPGIIGNSGFNGTDANGTASIGPPGLVGDPGISGSNGIGGGIGMNNTLINVNVSFVSPEPCEQEILFSPLFNQSALIGNLVFIKQNSILISNRMGSVQLWERTSELNNWIFFQTLGLTGLSNGQLTIILFGTDVSVENDNLIIVGAGQFDLGLLQNTGAVIYFTRIGGPGTLYNETQIIFSPNMVDSGEFGASVAYQSNQLLISAPFEDRDGKIVTGNVYAYTLTLGVFTFIQQFNFTNDQTGDVKGANGKGFSISLPFMIVGTSSRFPQGAAWIWEFTGGIWIQRQTLMATIIVNNDYFGLSNDIFGNFAVVGAPALFDATTKGYAYIYNKLTNGTWNLIQILETPNMFDNNFGLSVCLYDVNLVVCETGYCHGYLKNSSNLFELIRINITGEDTQISIDEFGESCSIYINDLLIGAPKHTHPGLPITLGDPGAAYAFSNIINEFQITFSGQYYNNLDNNNVNHFKMVLKGIVNFCSDLLNTLITFPLNLIPDGSPIFNIIAYSTHTVSPQKIGVNNINYNAIGPTKQLTFDLSNVPFNSTLDIEFNFIY